MALAAVLAPGPAVLLMDEPTSQLDDAGAAALGQALRRLAAGGTAVAVAEHRPDRARALADRVVAVRRGRLADADPDPPAPRRARAGGRRPGAGGAGGRRRRPPSARPCCGASTSSCAPAR